MIVTVTKGRKYKGEHRYTLTFSAPPDRTFGPYDFAEAGKELYVAALLPRMDARNLVLDAFANGSATAECGS